MEISNIIFRHVRTNSAGINLHRLTYENMNGKYIYFAFY